MKFAASLIILALTQFVPSLHADEVVGAWNLTALKNNVPAMKWLRQDQPVHSLLYAGEMYQGRPTQVFAFYASPLTLGAEVEPGTKFPGVVLIHGGGGTAFAEWAYLWAKRGYAAIAMDLAGSRPPDPVFDAKTGAPVGHQANSTLRTRLPDGGPYRISEKFDSIGGDTSDDWPYHAVASVMRAHTLLRSFPEVDAEHTAVTGISWGGYTTCLVASLDHRFKAAVPVYGCGFLHEGESVQKPSIDKLGDRKDAWVKAYDPGSLLPRCRVPIFFVNGTNDAHYVLDSYMKSFDVVPCEKQMRIEPNMRHGHPPGWAPQEIGLFIDSKCRGGMALPVPGKPVIEGGEVKLTVTVMLDREYIAARDGESWAPVKKAELHYTTDSGPRSKRQWKTIPAKIGHILLESAGVLFAIAPVTAPKPPTEANTWFLTITDDRDAMVSTTVLFQ